MSREGEREGEREREREREEEAEKEQEGEGESGGYIFPFCFVQFQPRIHNEEYISARNEQAKTHWARLVRVCAVP